MVTLIMIIQKNIPSTAPNVHTSLPTPSCTTSGLDPVVRALLEQNQTLKNSLFTYTGHRGP